MWVEELREIFNRFWSTLESDGMTIVLKHSSQQSTALDEMRAKAAQVHERIFELVEETVIGKKKYQIEPETQT
jgi:hypothetical protein